MIPHYTKQPASNRPAAGGGVGKYTTWEAVTAFHVNRLDWVYSDNSTFVGVDSRNHGIRAMTLSINANLPDRPHAATCVAVSSRLSFLSHCFFPLSLAHCNHSMAK
jgi:hypothetical protein